MITISIMQKLWQTTKSWNEMARQRKELRSLSDEILKDIGISRTDALHEANRHFWDRTIKSDPTLRKSQASDMPSVDRAKKICCT